MKLMNRDQELLVDGAPVWMRIDYDPARTKQDRSRGRKTECLLLGKKASAEAEPPVLSHGVTYQNPIDRYDKLAGRKHAFKDAIEKLLPRGPEREGVWAWYRATVRQPENDRILMCPHCGKPILLHPRQQHLAPLTVTATPVASLKPAVSPNPAGHRPPTGRAPAAPVKPSPAAARQPAGKKGGTVGRRR